MKHLMVLPLLIAFIASCAATSPTAPGTVWVTNTYNVTNSSTINVTNANQVTLIFHVNTNSATTIYTNTNGVGGATTTLISNALIHATSAVFVTQVKTNTNVAALPYAAATSLIPTWGEGWFSISSTQWVGSVATPAASNFVIIQNP